MKELDLHKCKTNKEVCNKISERIKEISIEDLIKEVNKKFIYVEEVVKVIYTGLSLNMNVFLSGPGGFGKSTLIKYILNIYKIPYVTIVGYKDMPVDALLGVPNIDKLINESKYEINFKDSVFFQPGILIGEEFTDILPSTAAALKDILTEKGYRFKGNKTESLISSMIIAANKNANDMSIDDSMDALYKERFPLQIEVVWKKYTADHYYNFLKLIFKDENSKELYFISKLFENNFNDFNIQISPRTAIDFTNTFLKLGLDHITGFNVNLTYIKKIKQQADEEYLKIRHETTLQDFKNYLKTYELNYDKKEHLKYYYFILLELSRITVSSEKVTGINDLIIEIKHKIKGFNINTKEYIDILLLIKGLEK